MSRTKNRYPKRANRQRVDAATSGKSGQDVQIQFPDIAYILSCKNVLGSLSVFIIVFAVYLTTLSPTVTSGDSGELITAAYDLGVAHPPGYPLWTLIAHVFIKTLPFESVAYRVNLMSAFFGAATCVVMFWVMRQLTIPFLASITAALCLGCSKELWAQSVIAEVYTLNSFLAAILFFILIQWHKTKKIKLILLLSFVFGIALTNHQSLGLLGPIGLVFILMADSQIKKNWPLILLSLAVFFLGLLIYLYLPWAAKRNCYMNWGDTKTLKNFVEHVLRSQYPSNLTKIPRVAINILGQLGASVKFLFDQFTPFLAVLLPAGIIAAWRNSRTRCVLLLAVFFVFETACMFILNLQITRQDLFSITVFYIPAYLICSVFLGHAFSEIGRLLTEVTDRIQHGKVVNKCCMVAACLPVLLTAHGNFSENDWSNRYYAYDHGKNILDTMQYGSVIFPSGDHNTFPLIYLIHVEKYRQDIILADKYGYVETNLLKDANSPPLDDAGHISKQWAEKWIIEKLHKPVYFTVSFRQA